MTIKERIAYKLTSAKFWLAIMIGYSFVYGVTHRMFSRGECMGIIAMVCMAYFNRDKK